MGRVVTFDENEQLRFSRSHSSRFYAQRVLQQSIERRNLIDLLIIAPIRFVSLIDNCTNSPFSGIRCSLTLERFELELFPQLKGE